MINRIFLILAFGCASGVVLSAAANLFHTPSETLERPAQSHFVQKQPIYIRTEGYARPPYSGATYFIYERGGEVICTKLSECSKNSDCEITYRKGVYKDEIDGGEPSNTTEPVVIPANKLRKHVCLTKFKLIQ